MPIKNETPVIQHTLDFDNPLAQLITWPANDVFPLNLKDHVDRRTVMAEIVRDVNKDNIYLVVTGFTSLANIIEFFVRKVDFEKLNQAKNPMGLFSNHFIQNLKAFVTV